MTSVWRNRFQPILEIRAETGCNGRHTPGTDRILRSGGFLRDSHAACYICSFRPIAALAGIACPQGSPRNLFPLSGGLVMKSLYFLGVVACASAIAFAACSSDDSGTTPAATGGSAGAATGGSAGSATGGSAGAATGGSAGAATGGSAGAATGGSAGAATGGSAGEAGSPGDGGSCKKCSVMVLTSEVDLTKACPESAALLGALLTCGCDPANCGGTGPCGAVCTGDAGSIDQACTDCETALANPDGGACAAEFGACLADK